MKMRIVPREILYWKHRGIKDQFSVGLLKFSKFHRNLLSWNYLLIIVAHLSTAFWRGKCGRTWIRIMHVQL